jgi:acyl-coenzyme A synthetase/AMP-(fatty) acid ligase
VYDIPLPATRVHTTTPKDASSRTSFIIHSSGSTGLPKPIFQTHKACLTNYSSSTGYRAFLTLPLYHNHGLSTFFRGVYSGNPTYFFNANLPLSASNLLRAMEAAQPESFHGVPYALKLLAETDQGIKALAKCKLVLYGGSSCPDELGDKLVNAGVYVVGHYGATEMGQLVSSLICSCCLQSLLTENR